MLLLSASEAKDRRKRVVVGYRGGRPSKEEAMLAAGLLVAAAEKDANVVLAARRIAIVAVSVCLVWDGQDDENNDGEHEAHERSKRGESRRLSLSISHSTP